MKWEFFLISLVVLFILTALVSCKKENPCVGCNDVSSANRPPNAEAGPDRTISLPTDSVIVDGSASADPDGSIVVWLWTKLSGPSLFSINDPSSLRTLVKSLRAGVYSFELTVTDNKGFSDRDTMLVIVVDPTQPNRPPIADAGPDQTIILPVNGTQLNGTFSNDPDNNIIAYSWTKVSGPSGHVLSNAASVQSMVTNLVFGIYRFELMVSDAGGLTARDTVQVTVSTVSPPSACDNSNRPLVSAQLIPIGMLSQPRLGMGVAAFGNIIVFAGGYLNFALTPSSAIDIYNLNTQTFSTSVLTIARARIMAVAGGNKIFLAGGEYYHSSDVTYDNPISVNVMETFDMTTNSWSVVQLPSNRVYTASAYAGDKIYLVEGNEVDIYDINLGTWTIRTTSDGRVWPAVVTTGSKVYFAGGMIWQGGSSNWWVPQNTIDVLDVLTQTWTTTRLSQARTETDGIAVNGKAYFAGGYTHNINSSPTATSCNVDIIDANASTQSVGQLSRQWRTPISFTVTKNNKIAFLTGDPLRLNNSDFDIYDISAGTWSIGRLPLLQSKAITGAAAISYNYTVYIAGTYIDAADPSAVLYRMDF